MQEISWLDRMKLTDNADQNDVLRALFDPNNKAVALHKPGSRIEYGDVIYEVQPNGSWKRVGLK